MTAGRENGADESALAGQSNLRSELKSACVDRMARMVERDKTTPASSLVAG